MEASQHVYVVKVRALPDPALLFPSERRYSALTVGGLAAGHAVLGAVALLLGALALSWDPPQGSWFGHLGAGLWLGAAALQASLCGLLAWRRWYEDRYIVWFFRSSVLAAVVAGAGLVLTSAALAHLYENVLSVTDPGHLGLGLPAEHPLYAVHDHRGVGEADGALGVGEEGSGGGPSWLDLASLPLPDANSTTISSGGVFSDLVRDQDHDLVAADSTHHEDLAAADHGQAALAAPEHDSAGLASEGEPEWSVLRWVPLPLPPRASAQVRSLVAANVLVACFLELLWSLLGARLAWRGMQAADVDIATAVPASAAATRPSATSAGNAPTPILASLERGAADGKVDVDADQPSDGELKKGSTEREVAVDKGRAKQKRRQQQPANPASLHRERERERRRRAPDLPEDSPLPPSLEQRTMNLEERVARLLGAERADAEAEHTNGQA